MSPSGDGPPVSSRAAVCFITDPRLSPHTGTCVQAKHSPLQPGHQTPEPQHIHPPKKQTQINPERD